MPIIGLINKSKTIKCLFLYETCFLYSTYLQLIVVTSLFLPKKKKSYYIIDTQIIWNYDEFCLSSLYAFKNLILILPCIF